MHASRTREPQNFNANHWPLKTSGRSRHSCGIETPLNATIIHCTVCICTVVALAFLAIGVTYIQFPHINQMR